MSSLSDSVVFEGHIFFFMNPSLRWLRSMYLEGCVAMTVREVQSGMMWLALWILKVCWCQPPNRTSWRLRSKTQRCYGRNVKNSLKRSARSSLFFPFRSSLLVSSNVTVSLSVGEVHWIHHSNLWLWRTWIEAHLETCYWDLWRGLLSAFVTITHSYTRNIYVWLLLLAM